MRGRREGISDLWMREQLDGWVDGWMDGWTDGWMDGWIQVMLGIVTGLPNMWVRNSDTGKQRSVL